MTVLLLLHSSADKKSHFQTSVTYLGDVAAAHLGFGGGEGGSGSGGHRGSSEARSGPGAGQAQRHGCCRPPEEGQPCLALSALAFVVAACGCRQETSSGSSGSCLPACLPAFLPACLYVRLVACLHAWLPARCLHEV